MLNNNAYKIIMDHFDQKQSFNNTVRLIIQGTAGTGKTWLIKLLRRELGDNWDGQKKKGYLDQKTKGKLSGKKKGYLELNFGTL